MAIGKETKASKTSVCNYNALSLNFDQDWKVFNLCYRHTSYNLTAQIAMCTAGSAQHFSYPENLR